MEHINTALLVLSALLFAIAVYTTYRLRLALIAESEAMYRTRVSLAQYVLSVAKNLSHQKNYSIDEYPTKYHLFDHLKQKLNTDASRDQHFVTGNYFGCEFVALLIEGRFSALMKSEGEFYVFYESDDKYDIVSPWQTEFTNLIPTIG